jgi:hypothetical protein
MRTQVDLNAHISTSASRGNPADFNVTLQPVFHEDASGRRQIAARRAIVREDSGEAIAVVSDRYTLVPHTRILEIIEQAIRPLDVGPVPRGIYVDRHGARLRALYKFPALTQPVVENDDICPCVQVRNTYDGTARIALHIGAFRFVCTNLSVGGAGAFAGGFLSVHAGDIPIEEIATQLADYLTRFDQIVRLYRQWSSQQVEARPFESVLKESLNGRFEDIRQQLLNGAPCSVFEAYNRLTDFATHRMRSARTAFAMLERVNTSFQNAWPLVTQ